MGRNNAYKTAICKECGEEGDAPAYGSGTVTMTCDSCRGDE